MKRFLRQILPAALCLSALGGCMKWDYGRTEDFSATERGLFIVNEGMFQYGNATLSYYDPETKTVENEVFHRANAFKLMSKQAQIAARAAGRAVDVSAEDFEG